MSKPDFPQGTALKTADAIDLEAKDSDSASPLDELFFTRAEANEHGKRLVKQRKTKTF